MRSRLTAALTAFAMLGLAPSFAMAGDDVQNQLQQMQNRLQQMEDRLQATNDQLGAANQRVEDQAELIEGAGLTDTRGASSGLGCLVCDWTIGGWVAASYNYNLNDPNDARSSEIDPETGERVFAGGLGGSNLGSGLFYDPLHPDHNSFALDQVWFEIEKEVSEESRAGFRTDFVYGKTAKYLNGGGPFNSDIDDDTALYIHQAYVQYAPPIGPEGTVMKFGKFATLIGAEVAGTIYNYNITRGQVWNLLEPIDHIGILVGGPIGDSGLTWALGGVNGFAQDDPDINDGKSVTGHLGWGNDQFSIGANAIWGPETRGYDGDEAGLVNLLAKWTPSDRFGMYVNGNFAWMDDPQGTDLDPYAWGVSIAGRYGITERTGFALRGDYVQDEDGFVLFSARNGGLQGGFGPGGNADLERVWSITGTLDHLLTDQLMVRAEARYDKVSLDGRDNEVFFQNSRRFRQVDNGYEDVFKESDQITLFLEVVYNFNKFIGN
jgi:hypothetical protein